MNEAAADGKKRVFLNHKDLVTAWHQFLEHKKKKKEEGEAGGSKAADKEGEKEEEKPQLQMAVVELGELCLTLLQGSKEWNNVCFIGPSNGCAAPLSL